jgi:hypothetical protein
VAGSLGKHESIAGYNRVGIVPNLKLPLSAIQVDQIGILKGRRTYIGVSGRISLHETKRKTIGKRNLKRILYALLDFTWNIDAKVCPVMFPSLNDLGKILKNLQFIRIEYVRYEPHLHLS